MHTTGSSKVPMPQTKNEERALKHDPLAEADKILSEDFYGRNGATKPAAAVATPTPRPKKPKPTHYKVICISLYTKDLENLESKVAELKSRGYTKANKSQLIRYALSQLDIDKLPPPSP